MIRICNSRFIGLISIICILMHDEFLNLADMSGVQDHVSSITQEAFAVRPLHAVDQSHDDEVVFVEHIAEFRQAGRSMIDGDLMDGIALRRGHIHCNEKSHLTLHFEGLSSHLVYVSIWIAYPPVAATGSAPQPRYS